MLPNDLCIVNKMREKRLSEGLSFRDLSLRLGISFSSLARIERGQGTPSPVSYALIMRWLELPYGESLDEDIQRKIKNKKLAQLEETVDRIDANVELLLKMLGEELRIDYWKPMS
jgi:transcriptional regulator with XRE-family HTH domain